MAAAGLIAAVMVPAAAGAAVFTVPCSGPDGGAAGLVKAINDANARPGPDTIELAAGCTYGLTTPDAQGNGLPGISSELDIVGNGARIVRVSRSPFRIMQVVAGAVVTLDDLTIMGGSVVSGEATAYAGGILNGGVLTITGSVIAGNRATGTGVSAAGAGITNDGVVNMSHSLVRGNSATSTGSTVFVAVGGGIINRTEGTMTISDSIIEGNSVLSSGASENFFIAAAGGVGSSGALTLNRTTVRANRAIANGARGRANGAGVSVNNGTLDMVGGSIVGSAATAVGPDARANGGGLENYGVTQLTGTTVTANRATGPQGEGGGIYNGFGLTLTNSVVSRNVAAATAGPARGGGILVAGSVALQNTPVVGNQPDNCNPSIPGC